MYCGVTHVQPLISAWTTNYASKCVLKMSSLYKFKAGNSSFEHEEISSTSQVSSQPLCEGIQTLVVTYGIPLFV